MRQKAEAVILPLLTGLLGFVASPFLRGFWDWCSEVALPAFSKSQKLSLVATLAIICVVLGVSLYSASSKRLLLRRYEHLEKRGFWIHRKTGQRVCGNCLIAGTESPLACFSVSYPNGTFHKHIWLCGSKDCKTEYFYKPGDVPNDEA
jgi:hypothetical protein